MLLRDISVIYRRLIFPTMLLSKSTARGINDCEPRECPASPMPSVVLPAPRRAGSGFISGVAGARVLIGGDNEAPWATSDCRAAIRIRARLGLLMGSDEELRSLVSYNHGCYECGQFPGVCPFRLFTTADH